MTSKIKKTIGTMACFCCGETIPVKQAENGTLDLSCKYCDFPPYAKVGQECHAIAMKSVKLFATEQAPPPAAPAAAQPAQPAQPPRKPASIFHMGG